jgi:hypothetical protein
MGLPRRVADFQKEAGFSGLPAQVSREVPRLDVETEMHHVTVGQDIILALQP